MNTDELNKVLNAISEKLDKTATKDDLRNMATKDDLRKMATKDDLRKMEKRLNSKFDGLFKSVDELASNTTQRVRHIERHTDIPPFKPIAAN